MATAAMAPALTGLQKAAILLVALGDQASAEMLKHLSDDEVQAVTAAIATLPPVSTEQAEAVLDEFRTATQAALHVGHGGLNYARRILTSAFGPEGSKKHLERLPRPQDKEAANHELARVDPQQLRAVCTQRTSTDGGADSVAAEPGASRRRCWRQWTRNCGPTLRCGLRVWIRFRPR